jgi:HD-GYP domain-containing protein (c-di-GMP phosphodiesterase class II)
MSKKGNLKSVNKRIERAKGSNSSLIACSSSHARKLDINNKKAKVLDHDLNEREIAIVERKIKIMGMQEELKRLSPLSGIYRVIKAMATERRLESLLDVITEETRSILTCERCSVFILDKQKGELWAQIAQGIDRKKQIRVALSAASVASKCARSARQINIQDAYSDKRFDPSFDQMTGYHTRNILCVPMLNIHGEVIGVFQALNKSNGSFAKSDEEWLLALTTVAAGLIEQAQAYLEIEHFVDRTLETLAQTIDKRDPLTAGHSVRVTNYSLLLGKKLEILESDIPVLRYSAMMHDYGKIGVPEAILWKNGRLTAEEFACVQQHARYTYDLLSNLPFKGKLASVPFVASCHHEKIDGSGYYRGLKGNDIPYLARIIAVADVFDALTSVRHYRNRMPIDKVADIMYTGKGNHFECKYVDSFFALPSSQVIKVMESERGQPIQAEVKLFERTSFKRLVELVMGAKAKKQEEGLGKTFEAIYNADLPPNYQSLD